MLAGVQEFCLRWKNHHNALVTYLNNLLQRESFVDVILAAEGQFIKVHRLVLCASSQYFEELLSQQTDKYPIIFLMDVTFVNLKAIVDYMYRGEVNISEDQLTSFLQTTEALKIRGLTEKQKSDPLTQPTDSMLSTVLKAAEQAEASSPPRTPLPVIASTSSMWDIEELPDEQEIHPSHSAAVASTTTNEEIEEIHEIKGQATSPVIHTSQIQHMDTDDHLIASSPKVEDPDIDISTEQLEGGDSVDDFGGDDISLWQNEGAEVEEDEEEDWSNSEGVSVASAPDDASGAGPSTSKLNDRVKPKGGKIVRRHACQQCVKKFRRKGALEQHLRRGCAKERKCPHCSYSTRHPMSFVTHLRCHASHGGIVYECQFCPYMTRLIWDYRNHLMKKHSAPQPDDSIFIAC